MVTCPRTPSTTRPRTGRCQIEGRIAFVEDRLARARVIDGSGQGTDRVTFGRHGRAVGRRDRRGNRLTIVGEDEADLAAGQISVTSPIARAIMGKELDSTVPVKVPKGTREFEILDIRFD